MNRTSAASSPATVVNPMVALQRRAFGFGGPGSTIQLVAAIAGPIAAMLLCSGRVAGALVVAAVLLPTPRSSPSSLCAALDLAGPGRARLA